MKKRLMYQVPDLETGTLLNDETINFAAYSI